MTPEVQALIDAHNPTFQGDHTNLQVHQCACATKPKPQLSLPDGGVCPRCGGMTVRTGTCTTCQTCGESGGCG